MLSSIRTGGMKNRFASGDDEQTGGSGDNEP
jgi:hypothetical protein